MLDAIRTYLSRIDQRPVEEIDRDINDELAAHLELLERELIDGGLSADAAREQALSRFGNPQTHKRRCRDVALLERRMKTTVQVMGISASALLLGAAAVSVWVNQQQTAHALDTLATRLDGLSQSLASRSSPLQQPASPSYNSVYVTGTPVSRPGAYTMPHGGLSLRRLLASAGVDYKFVKEVIVRHKNEHTAELPHQTLQGRQLADPTGPDVMLQNDDLITVIEVDR